MWLFIYYIVIYIYMHAYHISDTIYFIHIIIIIYIYIRWNGIIKRIAPGLYNIIINIYRVLLYISRIIYAAICIPEILSIFVKAGFDGARPYPISTCRSNTWTLMAGRLSKWSHGLLWTSMRHWVFSSMKLALKFLSKNWGSTGSMQRLSMNPGHKR